MPAAALVSLTPPVMLLVLLPLVEVGAEQQRTAVLGGLRVLQQQLGSAIRVLSVDAASHPAVVRSFQDAPLPAFILLRGGVELWRQPGLPNGKRIVAILLSKL